MFYSGERYKDIGGVLETGLARRCDEEQSHENLYIECVYPKGTIERVEESIKNGLCRIYLFIS